MLKPTFDKVNKIWSGPKVTPIYNPDQNLGQLIVRVLEQTRDAVTQISADTGISVTCGEMRERILKIAAYLNGLSLKQGDVVGVVAGNSENLAPTVFACFLLGLPVNSLASMMVESDIVQIFSKTKPKLIFCDESKHEIVKIAVKQLKSEAKVMTIMEKLDGVECISEMIKADVNLDNFVYPHIDPNSTAFIICSSGSTGSPKGTCKSHKEMIIHFNPTYVYNPERAPIFFQVSELFWFSGIYYLVLAIFQRAVRVFTADSSSLNLIRTIKRYKVTNIFTGPFAVANLLQEENLESLPSIRSWLLAGASISKTLCDKFMELIPNGVINSIYGSSECNFLTSDTLGEKFGSCGRVLENVKMKIIDDDGNALDNNQHGEICSKKAVPFHGYYNDPEKTAEAYDGEWFKTGDVGYFDEDGFFYFVDRKKEMLKYKGYQVTPSELEAIINEIDGVASSCVVGVLEQTSGNDIIHAFVIVDEAKGLTESFVLNFVNEQVMDTKRIRGGVHFLDTFPLGPSRKVDKKRLKEMAAEMHLTSVRA